MTRSEPFITKYPPGSFLSSPFSMSFLSLQLRSMHFDDFIITGTSPICTKRDSSVLLSSTTLASIITGAAYETLRSRASAGELCVMEPSSSIIRGLSILIFPSCILYGYSAFSISTCPTSSMMLCRPCSKNSSNELRCCLAMPSLLRMSSMMGHRFVDGSATMPPPHICNRCSLLQLGCAS